jgi:hypothetical protein
VNASHAPLERPASVCVRVDIVLDARSRPGHLALQLGLDCHRPCRVQLVPGPLPHEPKPEKAGTNHAAYTSTIYAF